MAKNPKEKKSGGKDEKPKRVKALGGILETAENVSAALEEWIKSLEDFSFGSAGSEADDAYEVDILMSEIGQVLATLVRTSDEKPARKSNVLLVVKRLVAKGLVSRELENAVDGMLDVISDSIYEIDPGDMEHARDVLVEELRDFQGEVAEAVEHSAEHE